jgi:SAM-dependent MidA family methyltransferase
VSTDLGMPALPPPTRSPGWRAAWDGALYGPGGFYRTSWPGDHFRTSAHESDALARAVLAMVRSLGLSRVVDVGAGAGELLGHLHRSAPDLDLVGVEVRDRPATLPAAVAWGAAPPSSANALVVAHEWLDTVPCHVVAVDSAGIPRMLHVDTTTGTESWGLPLHDRGVPVSVRAWLDEWWPLQHAGARAEVGSSRDRAAAGLLDLVDEGAVLVVDYAHARDARPPHGSLRGFRRGRLVPPVPDGTCDITADVALDAVAAALATHPRSTGHVLLPQHAALRRLGLEAAVPSDEVAATDPAAYLDALASATRLRTLHDPRAAGGYSWLVVGVGGIDPASALGAPTL